MIPYHFEDIKTAAWVDNEKTKSEANENKKTTKALAFVLIKFSNIVILHWKCIFQNREGMGIK